MQQTNSFWLHPKALFVTLPQCDKQMFAKNAKEGHLAKVETHCIKKFVVGTFVIIITPFLEPYCNFLVLFHPASVIKTSLPFSCLGAWSGQRSGLSNSEDSYTHLEPGVTVA